MPIENEPLKIMIFDATCTGSKAFLPGLSHSWIAGGLIYGTLGRFDLWRGFGCWEDALRFLAEEEIPRTIDEIQFWGHGKWGCVLIDGQPLDINAFNQASPYYNRLCAIRERLSGPESLIWFRTCETFGSTIGQAFAQTVSQFFNCRVAGHTYIIGPWQAGLYALRPNQAPFWSADDGLIEGTCEAPKEAKFSSRRDPRRIFCMQMKLPLWAHLP